MQRPCFARARTHTHSHFHTRTHTQHTHTHTHTHSHTHTHTHTLTLHRQDVGEAYAVLSDDTKKRRYDQGADLQEIEQGGGFGGGGFHGHDIDPNMIFEMFMGGGGGGRRSRGGFGGFGF